MRRDRAPQKAQIAETTYSRYANPLTDGKLLVHLIDMSKQDMSEQRPDVPYGTLDLLILKTLETMGKMNGYRIARRIEQVSGDALKLSQGAIYPALIRLEQEGWIRAKWGISETNRKVKFYSLTKAGVKQLQAEVRKWEQANALVARFLEAAPS
jgi:PadR family transcriptional regulator PadR